MRSLLEPKVEYEKTPNAIQKMARKLAPADASLTQSEAATPEPVDHPKVASYGESVAYAVITELFMHIAQDREMESLAKLITHQARVLAEFSDTDAARRAARINAQEVFTGSYDAVERKWKQWFESLPMSKAIVPVAITYLGMLALGLLVLAWRAALF